MTVPSSEDVAALDEAELGQAGQGAVAVGPVVEEGVAADDGEHRVAGLPGVRPGGGGPGREQGDRCPCGARCRPPSAPGTGRAGATWPRRRPLGRGRRRRTGRGSTPLRTTVRPRRRSRRPGSAASARSPPARRSGSRMAWRWQSISAGVVKSSTWWTVRTTDGRGRGPVSGVAVADAGGGPGGDAVLGVEDGGRGPRASPSAGFEGVDCWRRPFLEASSGRAAGRARSRGARPPAGRTPGPGRRAPTTSTGVAPCVQRLGQRRGCGRRRRAVWCCR